MNHPVDDNASTPAELAECIKKMDDAAGVFYALATRVNNHAFVEFTGLMTEYIKLCREAMAAGMDFTQANVHTGSHLPFAPHHIAYLNEKLECIYGLTFTVNAPKEEPVYAPPRVPLGNTIQLSQALDHPGLVVAFVGDPYPMRRHMQIRPGRKWRFSHEAPITPTGLALDQWVEVVRDDGDLAQRTIEAPTTPKKGGASGNLVARLVARFNPLDYPCPRCKAKIGESCAGIFNMVHGVHLERLGE